MSSSDAYEIVDFHKFSQDYWNSFVDMSPNAWLFHRYEWIEIEARLGGFERNLSFAVVDSNGQIAAIVPLYFRHLPLDVLTESVICTGLHRHAGISFGQNLLNKELLQLIEGRLTRLATKYKIDRMHITAQNLAEQPLLPPLNGLQKGLRYRENGISPRPGTCDKVCDAIVNLSLSEDEIFGRIKDRSNIRKAERLGLQFECVDSPMNEFETYMELACLSARRSGEALAHRNYFETIFEKILRPGLGRLFMIKEDGKPVATATAFTYKNQASYQTGYADPAALSSSPNNLIQWNMIKYLKANGFTRYKLGPVFPELPAEWAISRVTKFKAKFGGDLIDVKEASVFINPEKYLNPPAPSRPSLLKRAIRKFLAPPAN